MSNINRGTGRTTAQMKSAPTAAVFVWLNDRLEYPKILARHLGRRDLHVVGPGWLESGWIGRRLTGIVVDHAAELNERKRALLANAVMRIDENRHAADSDGGESD